MTTNNGLNAQASNNSESGVIKPTTLEIEIDEGGIIRNCNDNCETVVGFKKDELISKHISILVNIFSIIPVTRGDRINPHVNYICHCGLPFKINKKGESSFLCCRLNIITPSLPEMAKFKLLVNLHDGTGNIDGKKGWPQFAI